MAKPAGWAKPAIQSYMARLRASALAASALAGIFGCCAPALGQDVAGGTNPPVAPDANGNSPIETIVVIAQKRAVEQNAQSVPIALTAFGSQQLDALHVTDLQNLATAAPNVTLVDAGTAPGFANFTIRGLGVNSTIPSVEPTVGLFVDGIYLGMSAGAVFDLFDLEDIEILRGPQGLLFGRNTTGGAVLINTRRPGDQFAVRGHVNYESGSEAIGGASIEGPVTHDIRVKLSGYYDNDAGWFTNQFDGNHLGAKRTTMLRPTMVWSPSEAFDSTLIYERGWVRGQGGVGQNPAFFHGFDIDINNRGYNRTDWDAATLESNLRTVPGIFTNLFGYRRQDQDVSTDIDAQPVTRFDGLSVLNQQQYSDELRFAGTFFGNLDVTAGLYYFSQKFFYLERRVLAGGAIDSTMGAKVKDTNYAAFTEADYHILLQWTLVAGGRFTREEKTAEIATFVPVTAGSRCNFMLETCKYNFPGPAFPGAPGSDAWENFTPKLGFQWQPENDFLVYGHWTRGVRSGGYNVRNTSTQIAPGPYGPELQDAYEAGWKSEWFERRLMFNGAAFYDKIKDMQRDVNLTDPIVGVVQVTRNTADATIQGAELELTGAVTDDLVLHANAGYTDGKYDEVFFDLDGGGIGPSDLALDIPRLSKWSYSIGATYTHIFPNDFLFQLRTDYGYRSRAASTDNNAAFLAQIENLTASAAVTLPDRHWTFSLYGRNLLDKVTDGVVTPLPPTLGGGAFRSLNEGRVLGIEASFNY